MNILVLDGHPDTESFNHALAIAYHQGAQEVGHSSEILRIADLQFQPNLAYGYRQRTEWEPDLYEAWEKIQRADHLVWVHPVWWGGMPAISKGFIDRVFLPGKAFKYRSNSVWWDKLLKGKSARILTTLDQPGWYYRWAFGRPSVNQLKRSTLQFSGVSPVHVNYFGSVRGSTEEQRLQWLRQAETLGKKGK
jgi:NAD(P)H dehydrogenase (quinone)